MSSTKKNTILGLSAPIQGRDIIKKNFIQVNVFPNPAFRGDIGVFFKSEESGDANVDLFNSNGENIENLFDGEVIGGAQYRVTWHAQFHEQGLYFIQMKTASGDVEIRKAILLSE